MLDTNLKAQLKAYLERVKLPFVITASLDEGESSREMHEFLQDIVGLTDKITLKTDGTDACRPSFTLARPARLAEVVLKLSGWRERSYPLRVEIDGQEAYRGMTPRSLGYVTLPLTPVRGRNVRIVLDGQAQEGGGMRLTEVANQANTATGTQGVSTSRLAIVEAEFYERP